MTDSNELVHWRGRHADYPVKQVPMPRWRPSSWSGVRPTSPPYTRYRTPGGGIGLIVRPEPRERRAGLASDILHRSDVLYPWVGQVIPVVDAWWVQEAAWW